jgi:hypothetical protein
MLLALPPVSAHADIYACTGKTGMTVYQNFTCEIDSLGTASAPTRKEQAAATASGNTSAAHARAVAVQHTSSGTTSQSSGQPRVGMSAAEVKAVWGEPGNIYQDELVDGRVEIWTYDGSRSVHFNPRGRVVGVEQ